MEYVVFGSKDDAKDAVKSMYNLEQNFLQHYKLPKEELNVLYNETKNSEKDMVLNTAVGMLLEAENLEEIIEFYDNHK